MERSFVDKQDLDGLILVRDTLQLGAGFLLPHLLQLALSADLQVALLLTSETLAHQQQACRKLGVNLQNCLDTNKVIPIALSDYLTADNFLQAVVQQLAGVCKQQTGKTAFKGVCVLLDSSSVLAALSNNQQDWQAFLHYCQSLASTTVGRYACVVIAHDDIEDDAHWIRWLRHSAQIDIQVQPLESGASLEVTGQVFLHRRAAQATNSEPKLSTITNTSNADKTCALQHLRKLHFKLTPSDVKFFQ